MDALKCISGCLLHRAADHDVENEPPARPRPEDWTAKMMDLRYTDFRQRNKLDLDKPLPPLPDDRHRSGVASVEEDLARAHQHASPVASRVEAVLHGQVAQNGSLDLEVLDLQLSELHQVVDSPVDTFTGPSDQARRSGEYLTFEVEDEDDYTTGPMRVVKTSDGVKDCTGLLMTLEFSQEVQECVRLQRELVKEERAGSARRPVDESFIRKLKARLTRCEQVLAGYIVESRAANEALDTQQPEPEKLQGEVSEARSLLKDAERPFEAVEASISLRAEQLKRQQTKVLAFLEESFVYARLIDVDERPISAIKGLGLSLRSGRMRGGPRGPKRSGKQLDHIGSQPAEDFEVQYGAQDGVRQKYLAAEEALRAARHNLKNKEIMQDRERANVASAKQESQPVPDEDSETFELRWDQQEDAFVRHFNEARESFRLATVAATEAGVEVDGDEADFVLPPSSK